MKIMIEDYFDILLQIHPRDLPHPVAVDEGHRPEVCRRLLRDHPQSQFVVIDIIIINIVITISRPIVWM